MNAKPKTPFSVQRLDHITIIVRDLNETANFYVNLLGLEPIDRPGFQFPGLWFQAGPSQIHATETSDSAGQAGPGERSAKSRSRGQHFAFQVDKFEATVDFLRHSGVAFVSGPKQRPDGVRQVYIQDPDGYTVELCSQAE